MAETLTKVEILLTTLFEICFFLLFLRTKWYKKELGPYLFRKQLVFCIILVWALIANFLPKYPDQSEPSYYKAVAWFLIMVVFGEQLLRFIRDLVRSEK